MRSDFHAGEAGVMQYQSYIYGKNHWLLEPDLKIILGRYWPEWERHDNEFESFGDLVGKQAYEVADYVDQHPPELVMYDMNGVRVDRARLSPAHSRLLQDLAHINRPPFEGGSWHHHFCLGYLLADPGLYCTLIVTNQTAYAIYKYAPQYMQWLDKLLSGAAWGATWMTETQGGSDLGANTTLASFEDDVWKVSGEEKYFASNAGLADLALVTARPEGARSGSKGLALFLVPRLDREGQLNYRVRRFKRKSATRAVPTGEVELRASEAYLVGKAEEGIYYTMEILTVSRLANAIGAMGLSRKAHLEALQRVKARSAFGKELLQHALVRRDLTEIAVRVAGGLALVFHAVDAFQKAWTDRPPYGPQYHYARFLSHLAKNRTADHAAAVTQLAMELFGGLGFLDEYAVARLHREALITPIWEGTSNIQALELLEVMAKKGAHEAFLDDMLPILTTAKTPQMQFACEILEKTIDQVTTSSSERAQWRGKDSLTTLADVAQVALLLSLAEHGGEHYAHLADLYCSYFLKKEAFPDWALEQEEIWYPISV
jgi:acyl-CoA dehydrogenase